MVTGASGYLVTGGSGNQQSTRLSTTRLSPTLTDAAPATCQIILQKYTPILGVSLT